MPSTLKPRIPPRGPFARTMSTPVPVNSNFSESFVLFVPTSRHRVPLPAFGSLSTCQPPALWMFGSAQSTAIGAGAGCVASVASNGGDASTVLVGTRIVPSSGSAGPAIENAETPVRLEPTVSPKALSGPRRVSAPLSSVPIPENPASVLYTAPSVEVPFDIESFAVSFPPKKRTVPSELYSIERWYTSSAVENRKTYWSRSAGGVDCSTALYAARSRAMPARVASASGIRATRSVPLTKTDAPRRSRDGRFAEPAMFGHVASPDVSVRPFRGIEMEIEDVPVPVGASSEGPATSFANCVKGPAFDGFVRGSAARPLLLSMNTTPMRPAWSNPRSIMSKSERSPVHVVPDVQTCPR